MMLNTNQGFFCERDSIADSFFEASQLGALLSPCTDKLLLSQILQRLDVTHILIWNRDYGIEYPLALRDFLGDPELATLLLASPGGECALLGVRRRPVARQPRGSPTPGGRPAWASTLHRPNRRRSNASRLLHEQGGLGLQPRPERGNAAVTTRQALRPVESRPSSLKIASERLELR